MNSCQFFGRITRDIDLTFLANSGKAVAKFGIAVNRRFKNANGEYEADFFNVVAFGKPGEIIAEHFKKGSQIALWGRMQTGSYFNKDNVKVYTTDLILEGFDFVAGNSKGSTAGAEQAESEFDGMEPIVGEDMPF